MLVRSSEDTEEEDTEVGEGDEEEEEAGHQAG